MRAAMRAASGRCARAGAASCNERCCIYVITSSPFARRRRLTLERPFSLLHEGGQWSTAAAYYWMSATASDEFKRKPWPCALEYRSQRCNRARRRRCILMQSRVTSTCPFHSLVTGARVDPCNQRLTTRMSITIKRPCCLRSSRNGLSLISN